MIKFDIIKEIQTRYKDTESSGSNLTLAELNYKYNRTESSEITITNKLGEGWVKLVQFGYNGTPLCDDGNTNKKIRYAPNLERQILGIKESPEIKFNSNTINFRSKDILDILMNTGEYLKFLRKNYALATATSIIGGKIDLPEFPFFNQISAVVNLIGFVGANPILAGKLHRISESKKLVLEGKAPLEEYPIDKLLELYNRFLFERRATEVVVNSNGTIKAIKSDYFLKGTDMLMEEFLNLAAVGTIARIKFDEYTLSMVAGEEPRGLVTRGAKFLRNTVPGAKFLF